MFKIVTEAKSYSANPLCTFLAVQVIELSNLRSEHHMNVNVSPSFLNKEIKCKSSDEKS